ncbi:MAG: hypothetical protein PPP56_12085 [Longimonas sp.]|uniref:hypothetical protein n=1 Tax=Longimonas sp. TaxID=2039626 RepID=UPI00336286E7
MLQRLSEWKSLFIVLTALLLVGLLLSRVFQPESGNNVEPEVTIRATEARSHLDRPAEVCGPVTNTSYLPRIGGEPTFLNMGGSYPDQPFTAVIWGEHRGHWSVAPERLYRDAEICVRGRIRLHEGTPQVEVRHPRQVTRRR